MLRAIFDQKTRRDGQMSDGLSRSLRWWQEVLQLGIAEKRPWKRAMDRWGWRVSVSRGTWAMLAFVGQYTSFVTQPALRHT